MKHHLFSIFFSVLLALVSFESWGQSGLYTVTGDKVVIRSGPGTNYSKVSSRKKGDTVTVLSLYDQLNITQIRTFRFILKREPEANKNLNSNRFFINELMYAIVLISFIALVRY